jgi:hypothetical protein
VLAALAVIDTIASTALLANASAPYCGITCGSLARTADSVEVAALTNVRLAGTGASTRTPPGLWGRASSPRVVDVPVVTDERLHAPEVAALRVPTHRPTDSTI